MNTFKNINSIEVHKINGSEREAGVKKAKVQRIVLGKG